MPWKNYSSSVILCVIAGSISLSLPMSTYAEQKATKIVNGFREVSMAPGVTLYQKNNEYVHIVSLKAGGGVRLLYGELSKSIDEPQFARQNIGDWWKKWSSSEPKAFSLMNSQFFNTSNPLMAALAFSTKADGVVYEGYGDKREFLGSKMLLRIGEKHTIVQPYNDNPRSLARFPEPNIIVGLRADANKQSSRRLGRTFIAGIPDGKLLIFTSSTATQRYAERILVAFGANWSNAMMLDGGGSTQLVHEGKIIIPVQESDVEIALRKLPQALGIVAGSNK